MQRPTFGKLVEIIEEMLFPLSEQLSSLQKENRKLKDEVKAYQASLTRQEEATEKQIIQDRRVSKTEPASQSPIGQGVWFWQQDDKSFVRYMEMLNRVIEDAYYGYITRKAPAPFKFTLNETMYEIDFESFKQYQCNNRTRTRNIMRQ